MEELYELLKKKKLPKNDQIESLIMRKYSLTEVSQLKESLHNIVKRHSSSQSLQNLSHYSFYPDSDLSAQHNYCPDWDCRLNRIDGLARFAVLYADSIYIQDYFSDYQHMPTGSFWEEQYRRTFVGDIKNLLYIKELVLEGVVQFLSGYAATGAHICPGCFREHVHDYQKIRDEVVSNIKDVAAEYAPITEISISLVKKDQKHCTYKAFINGSEDLMAHGKAEVYFDDSGLSQPLREIISNIDESRLKNGYHLSREEVARCGLLGAYILERDNDIWIQLCLSAMSNSHLKFLTHNALNIRFLNNITKNPAINQKKRNY